MTIKNSDKKFVSAKLTIASLTLAVAQANYAMAEGLQLEEVVVTATKRAEGMQDVPIALSVMGGEKMREQGAGNLEDITAFMPNVSIAETSGSDAIYIRGIGSSENAGFEQSVGTFIDGVYSGRGKASRSAILDLERVEVLKGPQSTLFGKNTVAGAFSVTTAGPTEEFEGYLQGTYEPEFNGWGTTMVLSGALTDTINARLAVRHEETDGYFDNKSLNRDERQEEDSIARLTVDWLPTDELSLRLKIEQGESDTIGRQNTIGIASPVATAIYQNPALGGDPAFEADGDYDKYAQPIAGRPESYTDADWESYVLTANWDVGEFSIRSITAYTENSSSGYLDLDFGPLGLLGGQSSEDHEQFSQEILITSPMGETIEYMAGLFYQTESLALGGDIDSQLSVLQPVLASRLSAVQNALIGAGFADATQINNFDQDSDALSAFAQVTWHVAEDFRVIAGLRYSEDEKQFEKVGYTAALDTADYTPYAEPFSAPHQAFYEGFGLNVRHTFNANGFQVCNYAFQPDLSVAESCNIAAGYDNKRNEEHWTGDVILQYDYSDDVMLYAKYGTGYKAGGFDARNGTASLSSQEFEDESVESIELGAKMSLWDGRADMNIAIFHNQFEDVQVSIFDGVGGFVTSNAGETTTQGIEIDGQVILSENLYMRYALSYLDSGYDEYEGAACTAAQDAAFVPSAPGDKCSQDLAGQETKFSPEWSGNLGLEYRTNVVDGMELKASVDLQYMDDYSNSSDNDPVLRQDSFTKVNARVQLAGEDDRWSVALLGKNLTDETINNAPNDIPLGSFGFAGSYFFFLDAPRSYELQASYRF